MGIGYCTNLIFKYSLLEYLKGAKKRLLIFDFAKSTIEVVFDVPASVEFISHGRLAKNVIIYVENHKKVKCLDLTSKKEVLLFTMDA